MTSPSAIADSWYDQFVDVSRGKLLLPVGIDAAKDGKDEKNSKIDLNTSCPPNFIHSRIFIRLLRQLAYRPYRVAGVPRGMVHIPGHGVHCSLPSAVRPSDGGAWHFSFSDMVYLDAGYVRFRFILYFEVLNAA